MGYIICKCVDEEQDCTCPKGYPSLLCEKCGGIGFVKTKGRPPTGFNKKTYMKEYMRKKRAEKKQDEKRA